MSQILIDKIRKSRETTVTVDGHSYIVRRPTDEHAMRLHAARANQFEVARQCVTGWDLKELDLIPGGGPDPVPFHETLWGEYLADHADLWGALADAAMNAYRAHAGTLEEAAKN